MIQTISQVSVSDHANKVVMGAVTPYVLLVENDSQLAQLISQELDCERYQVLLIKDGISGLLTAMSHNIQYTTEQSRFSKPYIVEKLAC